MRGGPIDVWVVDEDARWRKRLSDVLARTPSVRCSQVLRTCRDAFVALQARAAPNILLFDPGANDADALELVGHLRSAVPATGAIALSAVTEEATVLGVIRSGAVGYLRKPVEEPQLVSAIHTTHAGGAPLDATIARGLVNHVYGMAGAERAYRLTSRERAIARRLVEGGSLKVMAASLGLSPHTVDTHLRNIYGKLGVHSKSAAVVRLLREGLV